jgi:hypothetical protein
VNNNNDNADGIRSARNPSGRGYRRSRGKLGGGTFGNAARFSNRKDILSSHSPGPIYDVSLVTQKRMPSWSWGSQRANLERQEREEFSRMHQFAEAGAAAYSVNLVKPSQHTHGFKFSTTDRFAARQPGISKHHDVRTMNHDSPGPIYYADKPSKVAVPSFSFGLALADQHGSTRVDMSVATRDRTKKSVSIATNQSPSSMRSPRSRHSRIKGKKRGGAMRPLPPPRARTAR